MAPGGVNVPQQQDLRIERTGPAGATAPGTVPIHIVLVVSVLPLYSCTVPLYLHVAR